MKYNLVVNQKAIIENDLNIDVVDGCILDYMYSFSHSAKIMKVFEGSEVYYFFSHSKIVADLPILKLKPDAVYRRLKKMCDIGLLIQHPNSKQLRMTLYAFTENIQALYFDDVLKAEASDNKPMSIGFETDKASVIKPNYNSTINNTTINKYPSIDEFVEYGLNEIEKRNIFKPLEFEISLKDKYNQWESANWHDGYGKKIKNWKSKLNNTLKFLQRYQTQASQNNINKVGKIDEDARYKSIELFNTASQ